MSSPSDRATARFPNRLVPYDEFIQFIAPDTLGPNPIQTHYAPYFNSQTSSAFIGYARFYWVHTLLDGLANTLDVPIQMCIELWELEAYRLAIWAEAERDAWGSMAVDTIVRELRGLQIGAPPRHLQEPSVAGTAARTTGFRPLEIVDWDAEIGEDENAAETVGRAVTQEESGEMCSICHEEFEMGQMVTVLPCDWQDGHVFHTQCVEDWFAVSGSRSCPFRCTQRPAT